MARGSTLTLNAGVRWSLYSPPWETNGMQTSTTVKLGDWFDQRAANAAQGIPSSAMPLLQFDLSGPANGKPGIYDWDYTNVAPRVSAAWTPESGGGLAEAPDGRQAAGGARRLLGGLRPGGLRTDEH